MGKKLFIGAPCLALLAACNGTSDGSAINPVSFSENAPERSVVMTANTPVEVSSAAGLLSIDFAGSEVGSSVQITEGDYAGVTFTKAAPISGKSTVLMETPDSVQISTALVGSIEDGLKATIQFLESDGVEIEESDVVNGTVVEYYTKTNTSGYTELEYNEISIGGLNNGVSAIVEVVDIDNNTSVAVGAKRYFEAPGATDDYQVIPSGAPHPQGPFAYAGRATVFGLSGSHTTDTASMTVNFEQSDGTFFADSFSPDFDDGQEPHPPLDIYASSELVIDNATGFISSSSGELIVDGVWSGMAINGVLSEDNDAVAGAIIVEGVSEIVGGVFALPRDDS